MDAQVYFFNYCNQMDLNQSSMAACAAVNNSYFWGTCELSYNNLTTASFYLIISYFSIAIMVFVHLSKNSSSDTCIYRPLRAKRKATINANTKTNTFIVCVIWVRVNRLFEFIRLFRFNQFIVDFRWLCSHEYRFNHINRAIYHYCSIW